MSAPIAPPRNRRLGSLRNGSIVGLPKPGPKIPPPLKPTCCDDPKVEDDGEGHTVCRNCFTQISEANIVADVTFQEDSRGAAAVQGGFIGENARHASTLGAAITRATGAGERNAAQEVERNARRALDKFCPTLGIPETTRNQAINIFSLASRSNFSAGRRTDEVAAASLYAACRRQRNNQVMLIDISELLHTNVFRLGEVYKAMCKDIHLQENGGVGTQYLVEVESLIMKYCRKLEFGEATRQVAEDAVRIVRRMKRDWMVTGRHPAGLCGACIILAAKMNNFRRSTREVVYVAKVADITIMKRVHEFRRTKAAALTVEQFRDFGVRLKHQHDPPVYYESELKKVKLAAQKKKRDASSIAREAAEAENDVRRASLDPSILSSTPVPEGDDETRRKRQRTNTGELATPPSTQQEPRRDADGFAIPAIPTAQTPSTQTPGPVDEAPRKRGRPKKTPPEPIVITEEELAEEEQLEHDINDNLNDDEVIDSRNEIERVKTEERSKQLADQQIQVAADERKARRVAEGITWVNEEPSIPHEEATPAALEAEFENDPEVQNCLLSPPEQKVKEQIWVLHNEDWLRQQQEKKLIAAVAKAAGRDGRGNAKSGKVLKRKRKSKMGDGSTLAEATTPIETPADANRAMVQRRNANFSKYLNWEVLEKVFEPNSSRSTSARGSVSRAVTPSTGADENAGEATESATSSPEVRAPAASSRKVRVLSPPSTQAVAGATRSESPASARPTPTPPLQATPPPTQTKPDGGNNPDAEMEDEEDDPNDYVQDYDEDELDYGWGREDEREDIGEDDDDYRSAIGRAGGVGMEGEYLDDEFE